jgi:NADPH2:quinone reductase
LTIPATALQLRSTVTQDGKVQISLVTMPVPTPVNDEILVRVDAAPINPSDMGLLFGGADVTTAAAEGGGADTIVSATLPPAAVAAQAGRVGQSLPVGTEGAGEVVAAGDDPEAQALLGKIVALSSGSMYSQYRSIRARHALVLPEGTTAVEGASCFVNPLTVLGFLKTMEIEGYSALVHTAAASNLGQMLVKVCQKDGIPLVNIVRRPEQAELLRSIGAQYVIDSSRPSFMADLTDAIAETGATVGFDATGGGKLAGQILTAMEAALNRNAKEFSRYGSTTHKQVFIYGGLDRGPTEFNRAFGMSWGISGWLLTPWLQKLGPDAAQEMRERVAREVKTTFASSYTKEVSLIEALDPANIAVYGKQATGEKYLIRPNK